MAKEISFKIRLISSEALSNLKTLAAEIEKLNKKQKELKKTTGTASTEYQTNAIRLKELKKAHTEIQNSITGTNSFTQRLTSSFKNAVFQLGAMYLGFQTLIGVVTDAFKTIVEYNKALADLRKTTGTTRAEAKALGEELQKIYTKTSINALMELGTAAGRLGLRGQDIIDFVKSADMAFVALGDSLEGSAEDIGLTLGKIADQFGLEEKYGIGGAIERIGSALNELGANSKAQEGNIVDFTNRLQGVASVANISATQIMALGALFDSTGQSMEVAATTFNKLLPELGKNTEKFASVAGVSIEEFEKLLREDAFEALKLVAKGASSSDTGLMAVTETLESFGIDAARSASIVTILSKNLDELNRLEGIATNGLNENISVQKEFQTQMETIESAISAVGKSWDRLILTSSGTNVFEDAVVGVLTTVKGVFDNIRNFVEGGYITKLKVLANVFIDSLTLLIKPFVYSLELLGVKTDFLKFKIEETTATKIESTKATESNITAIEEETAAIENQTKATYLQLKKQKEQAEEKKKLALEEKRFRESLGLDENDIKEAELLIQDVPDKDAFWKSIKGYTEEDLFSVMQDDFNAKLDAELEEKNRIQAFNEWKKEQELKQRNEILGITSDFFGALATLSKNNANLSKKFAIAQSIIDGARAVMNILAEPSLLPFPISSALKAIQIGTVGATTAAQIRTINSQSFAQGGYTGAGTVRDSTGQRVAGIVHENEYVVPSRILSTPRGANLVGQLEGMRGFANGGYTNAPDLDNNIMSAIAMLTRNQKVYVLESDITSTQRKINVIDREVSW